MSSFVSVFAKKQCEVNEFQIQYQLISKLDSLTGLSLSSVSRCFVYNTIAEVFRFVIGGELQMMFLKSAKEN